jgi:DNA invertase Pin-like site-specific DNA recombinase
MSDMGKALLYARVSTQLQVNDGVSLDVQERQLVQAAELAGFIDHDSKLYGPSLSMA